MTSVKTKNTSRANLAAKIPFLILPLFGGAAVIACGKRSEGALNSSPRHDTRQYGMIPAPVGQSTTLFYEGIKDGHFTFKFSRPVPAEEVNVYLRRTALCRFVIAPLGPAVVDAFLEKVVSTPDGLEIKCTDLDFLSFGKIADVVEYYHENAVDGETSHVSKEFGNPRSPYNQVGAMQSDKEYGLLGLIWRLKAHWKHVDKIVTRNSAKRCIITVFTRDNQVYVSEGAAYRRILSNGNPSNTVQSYVGKIAHVFVIKLRDDCVPPEGFRTENVVNIDLDAPYCKKM